MKFPFQKYAPAFLALLLLSCDKAEDDVLPTSFQTLSLQNDHYTTQVNQAVLLSVLANDHITGPAQITLGQPQHGTLSAGPEAGQYYYQPEQSFSGSDSFTYAACIGQACKTAQVSITVSALPCALVANFDADTTGYNQPLEINVLANDVLCDSSVITLDAGNATIREMITVTNNNTVLFTPQGGFYGVASFGYRISNGTSVAEGMVKVLVRQPITQLCSETVLEPDYIQVHTGNSYPPMVDLKALAIANDQICPNYPYTFELLPFNQYYNGSVYNMVSGTGSTLYYIPNYNSAGWETIGYQVRQQLPGGEVLSSPQYIYIHLTP